MLSCTRNPARRRTPYWPLATGCAGANVADAAVLAVDGLSDHNFVRVTVTG